MSFRPFTDTWILARPKVKYFGAYPAGFLQRARDLIGCGPGDQVLHVCSGKIEDYRCGPGCTHPGRQVLPYHHFHGFGQYDMTWDMDESLKADFHGDVRNPECWNHLSNCYPQIQGVLADPPYTEQFAMKYAPGSHVFPTANEIVKNSMLVIPSGGRVGILSLHWPRYPKKLARQIAAVHVLVGNGNLGRTFAVFEKL